MPNNQQQSIPITPGQRIIMQTVKDELFPCIEKLKDLLVEIQKCRISYQLYSPKLIDIESSYYEISESFFEVVKKLETPDILFKNADGGERNIVDYFQFRGAIKDNIAEGLNYVEIIDRTLDRKAGTIVNNRTFLISIIAVIISIYFAN